MDPGMGRARGGTVQAAVRSGHNENVFTSYKTTSIAERRIFQGKAAFKTAASKATTSALFLRVPETHIGTVDRRASRPASRQEPDCISINFDHTGGSTRFQAIPSDSIRFC